LLTLTFGESGATIATIADTPRVPIGLLVGFKNIFLLNSDTSDIFGKKYPIFNIYFYSKYIDIGILIHFSHPKQNQNRSGVTQFSQLKVRSSTAKI